MSEKVREQILAIRDTGLTNMLAYERDFFELVTFIEESKKEYCDFILYGKRPA